MADPEQSVEVGGGDADTTRNQSYQNFFDEFVRSVDTPGLTGTDNRIQPAEVGLGPSGSHVEVPNRERLIPTFGYLTDFARDHFDLIASHNGVDRFITGVTAQHLRNYLESPAGSSAFNNWIARDDAGIKFAHTPVGQRFLAERAQRGLGPRELTRDEMLGDLFTRKGLELAGLLAQNTTPEERALRRTLEELSKPEYRQMLQEVLRHSPTARMLDGLINGTETGRKFKELMSNLWTNVQNGQLENLAVRTLSSPQGRAILRDWLTDRDAGKAFAATPEGRRLLEMTRSNGPLSDSQQQQLRAFVGPYTSILRQMVESGIVRL